MKTVLLLLLVVGAHAMAEGPFGKNVTGKSLILGVDDCAATKMVDKAVAESGIPFVDGNARQIFGCEQLRPNGFYSNGGALESMCKSGKVKCYSEGSNAAVCVANPRSVALDKEYGDAGKVVDHRPRFDGLFVFSKDGAGYLREKSWRMDGEGCNPTSANLNNPMQSEAKCREYVKSYVSGGYLFKPSISQEKFCDGKITTDKINAIRELGDCLESYPQLRDLDSEKPSGAPGKSEKPASTK